ncbi:MAG: hypothetical protein WC314_10610 [Vulcanimicrobiota bacterium]
MSELLQVLRAFENPSSVSLVAQRLGWSERLLQGVLRQLQARGLVAAAEPGFGECISGCGACAMQNFCPSSTPPGQDPDPVSSKPPIWRLTTLGEQTVGQPHILTGEIGHAG